MTRNEAWELLGLAGGMTRILRNRPAPETAMRSIRDRLVELAGGVDCPHCESDDGCDDCVVGWTLPEEVTL